jgi:hypothetical protein
MSRPLKIASLHRASLATSDSLHLTAPTSLSLTRTTLASLLRASLAGGAPSRYLRRRVLIPSMRSGITRTTRPIPLRVTISRSTTRRWERSLAASTSSSQSGSRWEGLLPQKRRKTPSQAYRAVAKTSRHASPARLTSWYVLSFFPGKMNASTNLPS